MGHPHRLCPHVVVVVVLACFMMIFEAMQVEPLMPNRLKGRDQTKRDTGFTPCARDGEVASAH